MSSETGKLYQDRLYGTKELSPLAVAVIDTPEFQRLGEIRQLAFTDKVYRGARHTRFEHSVGTYFMTRRIMRRISQNHERLQLDHPGAELSDKFRMLPGNFGPEPASTYTSYQARWRGATEAVSIAALVHDIGHAPFGHTLEDEFAGIYDRHDSLAGPRLYEMLFNPASALAEVFSATAPNWIPSLPNPELAQLIYVILNWKESIDSRHGFDVVLQQAIAKERAKTDSSAKRLERVTGLSMWHTSATKSKLFYPFMSDVIANTICADLLDYLPRDTDNLGLEHRPIDRLLRYFTIRPGTLYANEGPRVSLMVTRKGRGGQRRDVATAVIDIMRERYEMAERVYYHHKKCAYSAMLVKMAELLREGGGETPRDDDDLYPMPWSSHVGNIPHVTHLSDSSLIDYLGAGVAGSNSADPNAAPKAHLEALRLRIYNAIRFNRRDVFRTLLVIDADLADAGRNAPSVFADRLRGPEGKPSSKGRRELEILLESTAGIPAGSVLVYCPSLQMQAKEVDVRLELKEDRVVPLRVQKDFIYNEDVRLIGEYYQRLWRAYIFVAPEVYQDQSKCKLVVDAFCGEFGIDPPEAYKKMRRHSEQLRRNPKGADAVTAAVDGFLLRHVSGVPSRAREVLHGRALEDQAFLEKLESNGDVSSELASLLETVLLDTWADKRDLSEEQSVRIEQRKETLISAATSTSLSKNVLSRRETFDQLVKIAITATGLAPDTSRIPADSRPAFLTNAPRGRRVRLVLDKLQIAGASRDRVHKAVMLDVEKYFSGDAADGAFDHYLESVEHELAALGVANRLQSRGPKMEADILQVFRSMLYPPGEKA
jgi:HD superfamily phosphohydrolase